MVQGGQSSVLSDDERFLAGAAAKILSGTNVATSSAKTLVRQGIDAARLAKLIAASGGEVGEFRMKVIVSDPANTEDFGVFVRRVPS